MLLLVVAKYLSKLKRIVATMSEAVAKAARSDDSPSQRMMLTLTRLS